MYISCNYYWENVWLFISTYSRIKAVSNVNSQAAIFLD